MIKSGSTEHAIFIVVSGEFMGYKGADYQAANGQDPHIYLAGAILGCSQLVHYDKWKMDLICR